MRLAIPASFDTLKGKFGNTFVGVKATNDTREVGQQDDGGRWKQLEEHGSEHE